MLDKRYGLKYSMPHSIVHIVDNSMYAGELPIINADDPSIYSTIVVTGSPIGVDNEIVTVTRSDVLNVAFGMSDITTEDVNKYGQTITYPADLINQNVPIKFLRITPEGATYAFSCLLMQWRVVNDTILAVRYKTADSVPTGKILQNFKNPKRLHESFVNNIPKTVTDYDGTVWNQRVFMTFISAGRGSGYNKFNYTINRVQQSRRPANIKYLFTTFNSLNNAVVEKFFASLFNENNELRPDAMEPLNKVISQRLGGSSVLIPTLNESAVRELYNKYMSLLKQNIDNEIYTLAKEEVSYNSGVYKTLSINTFDPIFGCYIYEGDSDVKLPFMRIEMVDVDVPRLEPSNCLDVIIGGEDVPRTSPSIVVEANNRKTYPVELETKLTNALYGVGDSKNKYHIGNVYLSGENARTLQFAIGINQITGAATYIPITKIYCPNTFEPAEGRPIYYTAKPIATVISITDAALKALDNRGIANITLPQGIEEILNAKLSSGDYKPTLKTGSTTLEYESDVIIYIDGRADSGSQNINLNCPTFGIAYVTYKIENNVVSVDQLKLASSKGDIYKALVYPSTTVTSFASLYEDPYWGTVGSTIVDGAMGLNGTHKSPTYGTEANVYVNGYYDQTKAGSSDKNKCKVLSIAEDKPFVVCTPPSVIDIKAEYNLMDASYDMRLYVSSETELAFKAGVRYTIHGEYYHGMLTKGLVLGFLEDDNVSVKLEDGTTIILHVEAISYYKNNENKFLTYEPGSSADGVPGLAYKDAVSRKAFVESMILSVPEDQRVHYPNQNEYTVIPPTEYTKIAYADIYEHYKNAAGVQDITSYQGGKWYERVENTDQYILYYYNPEDHDEQPPSNFDWYTKFFDLYTYDSSRQMYMPNSILPSYAPAFSNEVYEEIDGNYYKVTEEPDDWDIAYGKKYYYGYTGRAYIKLNPEENMIWTSDNEPYLIVRYVVSGTIGSIYKYGFSQDSIPNNYYSSNYGINPSSECGGVPVEFGSTGFFDNVDINPIIFKWKYSELLVKAYKGLIDPRIKSPTRCPAKYLFDGGTNTIIGQKLLPYMSYSASDIIQSSTIFTDDEKEDVVLDESILAGLGYYDQSIGIDVKQAMYDLMEYRCYYGLPDDKRPIGPGSGLSLHLDAGFTSATTQLLMNTSFIKRFVNPNASWDIGGYTSITDGITYTYTKHIVQNLFTHMKSYSINKPFVGSYSQIPSTNYSSFFPDIDTTDWELRELYYKSGGNAWIMDVNGNLQRRSQRSLYREGDTSDLIQESNMRTLSLLVYMLQNKIDSYLLEYNDDGVLKTLKEDVDNMFSNWTGNLVQSLDITFERDINPYDGGEIVVCYCNVTFRGLILRVPIIVNIQRRNNSGETT